MADEVSNKTVLGILIITMVVSLGGTFIVLNKISSIEPGRILFTGMATEDTGQVRINISSNLAIDVEDANSLIDFGTCLPVAGSSNTLSIASDLTQAQNNASINCTGGNLVDQTRYINVQNVGNEYANVTFESTLDGIGLLGSVDGVFRYRSVNGSTAGGCTAADVQTDWANIAATTPYNVCENLTYGVNTRNVYFYVNLTVPEDSTTGSSPNTATLTFTGAPIIS